MGAHLEDDLAGKGIEGEDRQDVGVRHRSDVPLVGELFGRDLFDRHLRSQLAPEQVGQDGRKRLVQFGE